MSVEVSVVVPTYNERETLSELVGRLHQALGSGYEVVVVDDSSPDGTAELARELGRQYPVRVLQRPGKLGLGSAVLEGARAASGRWVVVMDADLSHPPEVVPELVDALRSGAELAVGSRYVPGGGVRDWPWRRRLMSRVAVALARLWLRERVSDPVSGFFAARRELLLDPSLEGIGYKILLEVLVRNRGRSVVEVAYVFTDRRGGRSKLGAGEVWNYLRLLWRLHSARR
ncbi:MAG: polyprenol monophosphomannose synthase [Armatimonadota bacterium]|nr:polyprenol monophosphomannose synthase [Armatimonadota bacterium]MDR5675525.1 polyprenol monophosphomannose synthase [Armatimonadota bacterium]MDR5688835.1 polyprenol monophosphomannose synthase [Armatimonadota bacterium]MDR7386862.1 polyprenol monophosphomannose synthase [Armatimonadota bacterium]MDR7388916.1 polyprenol monophosphomannose synthase [Armatimonadota bacterium]